MSPKSPSPAYSLRLRVRLADRPGTLGALAVAIGEAGGNINALEGFELKTAYLTEDVIVYCADVAHQDRIRAAVEQVEGVELLHCEDRTFALHDAGKITVDSSVEIRGMDDLAMAYSPGVARVCSAIAAESSSAANRCSSRSSWLRSRICSRAEAGTGSGSPAATLAVT